MGRLIDADDVLAKIDALQDKRFKECGCPYDINVYEIVDIINACEMVDAVPVAHGKWIEKTGTLNDATFWWYECSECEERPLKYYGSDCLSRFCPNCGALMDEVTEDELVNTAYKYGDVTNTSTDEVTE